MFYELGMAAASSRDSQARRELLAAALRLGYHGAATCHTVVGQLALQDACSVSSLPLDTLLAAASAAPQNPKNLQGLVKKENERTFKQFNRLTVVASDVTHVNALNVSNVVVQSYDLVAIRPTNLKAFARACTNAEVDIISVDLSSRLPFRFHRPMLDAAIQKGIFFEITYSAALRDVGARRQLFANAQMLYDMTRGRNIIVSSGALQVAELRGPYDAANLATLFGFDAKGGRDALSHNCMAVLARSEERRTAFKAIKVEKLPQLTPDPPSLHSKPRGSPAAANPSYTFVIPKEWDPPQAPKATAASPSTLGHSPFRTGGRGPTPRGPQLNATPPQSSFPFRRDGALSMEGGSVRPSDNTGGLHLAGSKRSTVEAVGEQAFQDDGFIPMDLDQYDNNTERMRSSRNLQSKSSQAAMRGWGSQGALRRGSGRFGRQAI